MSSLPIQNVRERMDYEWLQLAKAEERVEEVRARIRELKAGCAHKRTSLLGEHTWCDDCDALIN